MEEILSSKKITQEWISKLVILKYEQAAFSSNLKALGISKKVSKEVKLANELGLLEVTNKLEKFMESSKEKLANGTSIVVEFKNLMSFQDLMSLCEICELDSGLYTVYKKENLNMYGKVTAKGNKFYVHAFRSQKPTGMPILLPYSDLLKRFSVLEEFPKRAFLQLRQEKLEIVNEKQEKVSAEAGEIVVMVDDQTTPRALNFLYYCSGIKGDSYIARTISTDNDYGYATFSSKGIGTLFYEGTKALVNGISDNEMYKAVIKLGSVIGCHKTQPDKLSGFLISCEDVNKVSNTKFGVVEEGMNVCKEVSQLSILGIATYCVNDCGLVFSAI